MTAPVPNPMHLAASVLQAQTAAFNAAQRAWSESARLMWGLAAPARVEKPFGPSAEKMTGTADVVVEGFETTFTREITRELIEAFADVSGDVSRIHLDEEHAKRTQFGGVIGHGLLTASFISAALSRLPGVIVYLSQDLKFMKPVRPGDVVTARVAVIERPAGKSWARLRTTCTLANGDVVLDGEAKVLVAREG